MGVPGFFSWIRRRYPTATGNNISRKRHGYGSLHLDLNSIIHDSLELGDDLQQPGSFNRVFPKVFEHISRIVQIVQPTKLYIAIDGVAPDAKTRGGGGGGSKRAMKTMIRPGTTFMNEFHSALRSYIARQTDSNPSWSDIEVDISDADEDGEGEHKIISRIRRQAAFGQSESHCIYGKDADLIMLALTLHGVDVCILRETTPSKPSSRIGYEYIDIGVLKGYLKCDLRIIDAPFAVDYNRVIDDFVFMSFFLGNDFLPPLANLEITQGGLDSLMGMYKANFSSMNGYLLDRGGAINLDRVVHFIRAIAATRRPSLISNEQYYLNYFKGDSKGCEKVRKSVASSYLSGLCWTARYYFQGACSQDWYYPHQHAPLAIDVGPVEAEEPRPNYTPSTLLNNKTQCSLRPQWLAINRQIHVVN